MRSVQKTLLLSISFFALISIGFAWLFISDYPEFDHKDLSSVGGQNRCEDIFSSDGKFYFSDLGLQFFVGGNERSMAYDYVPASKGKRTILFLHGLGDDMHSLEKFAQLAHDDGFGILRIDLHGHGQSLIHYLAEHQNTLPTEYDYRENVADIIELIKTLHIRSLSIVGHSYGGAIGLKLAEELPTGIIKSVHVFAPYLQRLDKYMLETMVSGNFLLLTGRMGLEQVGVAPIVFEPLARFAWNMIRTVQFFRELTKSFLQFDRVRDFYFDPLVEELMSHAYKNYFLYFMKKSESVLSREESQFLKLKVEAAIRITKGIRGLDYLNPTTHLGKFPKVFQLIGGTRDALITPQELTDFSYRLLRNKSPHDVIIREGDHFFPQSHPEEAYAIVSGSWIEPH